MRPRVPQVYVELGSPAPFSLLPCPSNASTSGCGAFAVANSFAYNLTTGALVPGPEDLTDQVGRAAHGGVAGVWVGTGGTVCPAPWTSPTRWDALRMGA